MPCTVELLNSGVEYAEVDAAVTTDAQNRSCITFEVTNTSQVASSFIARFYFGGLGTIPIVNGEDTDPDWQFNSGGPFPGCGEIMGELQYRFSTSESQQAGNRLQPGDTVTLQVCRTDGETFTEDDIAALLAAVHVQGLPTGDNGGNGNGNGDQCPLIDSVAGMEDALSSVVTSVSDNFTDPQDLPTVEKILKLVFLKNQLLALIIQECPDDNGNGNGGNGGSLCASGDDWNCDLLPQV
ncbi:hypothetical protein GWK91_00040 [Virgibacillus sp. MSP4-1]|uniref:hypothetical protein n=1 Tax=Virgibacillus sp. MSP4-1 TaxID=2700081 RepID=UPI0003A712A7|nr:hypothetical protein [Virgibacillus sp. MSP4-1]QHS21444.1 hypothetical protein GWK91_00040 [Virgibacillus sp. MSP4-1]